MQQSIDWVREQRNSEVKHFFDKSFTIHFLQDKYKTSISDVKFEFLVRDLQELLISPVDLAYYASLLKSLTESTTETSYEKHGNLITLEFTRIIQKYL